MHYYCSNKELLFFYYKLWFIAAVSKSVLTAIKKKEKTGVNSLGRRPKTNTAEDLKLTLLLSILRTTLSCN